MSKWSDVWPRGVPQVPAIRIGRSGLRITQEMWVAMGRPWLVDIIFSRDGTRSFMGLRPGHNHWVRTRKADHAVNVNSRPLGRMLSHFGGQWLLAEERDGLWGAWVTDGGADDA